MSAKHRLSAASESTCPRAVRFRQALDSLEWLPGEPLLVGSSHRGAIARILLGADSSRIIRSARVPVIVLPRGAEPAVAA